MFARSVSFRLKLNVGADFAAAIEKDALPRLRRQMGFRDQITFLAPGEREGVAITFWELKENADAYNRAVYPDVLKALARMIEGMPHVRGYEVANSTFYNIPATAAAGD